MKIKKDYVIKKIGEDIIVVPIKDEAVKFNGIITLNKTGKFIFELLQQEDLEKEELITRMLDQYEVEKKRIIKDIDKFIKKCRENELLEEKSL